MLDRQLLKALKDAAKREDWSAVGDAYLELAAAPQEQFDRFALAVLKAEVRRRDSERVAHTVDELLATQR